MGAETCRAELCRDETCRIETRCTGTETVMVMVSLIGDIEGLVSMLQIHQSSQLQIPDIVRTHTS